MSGGYDPNQNPYQPPQGQQPPPGYGQTPPGYAPQPYGTPQGYGQQPQGYAQPQGAYPQQAGQPLPPLDKIPPLVLWGFIFAIIPCCAPVGVIMCGVGLGEAKKRQKGESLAYVGMIVGLFWIVVGILARITNVGLTLAR